MSFRRVQRRLVDQPKPFPVKSDGIILQWKDNPPSPSLTILIGHQLAILTGRKTSNFRVHLLIGEGEDEGKCAIRFVDLQEGDYRVQSYRDGYRIHLPCHISVEHFTFCKRTAIDPEAIEIRDGMLIFAYEGVKA